MKQKGYRKIPLSFNRKMVRASASVSRRKNAIHAVTEVDISEPRRLIREHREKTGEKLSLTAYIVCCLSHTLKDHPALNSFIRRGRLILLEDIAINVLVEKDIEGENVPEPYIVREAQGKKSERLGSLTVSFDHNIVDGAPATRFMKQFSENISNGSLI